MLVEFRVENHRSIRDEQALTMEAGRVGDMSDLRPREINGHHVHLLTVAGIYGANASGKSNVLSSLAFMRDAVLASHRLWAPEEGIPRDPFGWGSKRTEPSLFEVTFIVDSIKYQYGFRASNVAFLEEWLFAWPNGKKTTWFARDDGGPIKFGDQLKGENRVIEEVTRPNALFLSAAAQHRHAQLQPISAWFRSIRAMNLSIRRMYNPYFESESTLVKLFGDSSPAQPQLFEDSEFGTMRERFRELLRKADTGIVDLRVISVDVDEPRPRKFRRFVMQHQTDSEDSWLPLEEESRGTQTLFRMGIPILQAMDEGGILIVDELEASLHPALAQQIVRQFNDPVVNHRNAQIIFTTHDTNLLGTTIGEPALRRDQVWLTEKNTDGATVLYPLTDFNPRKAENLERGYLQGRYGAIPFLGEFSIAAD